jgi:microcompartment protein CcmL/EutN
MDKAIGLIELNSIAKGFEVCDTCLKTSAVKLITSQSICPGKYIVFVNGKVAEVKAAIENGVETGGRYVVDSLVIPSVDDEVFPALYSTKDIGKVEALGVIETFSVVSAIYAADAAVKAANVNLIEIRMAMGLGGKAFVSMTGSVSDVKAAVEAGESTISDSAMLVASVVIPSPHERLKDEVL